MAVTKYRHCELAKQSMPGSDVMRCNGLLRQLSAVSNWLLTCMVCFVANRRSSQWRTYTSHCELCEASVRLEQFGVFISKQASFYQLLTPAGSPSSPKIGEIHAVVKNEPDITLAELIEKRSLPIRKSHLSRLLIYEGYSLKRGHRKNRPEKSCSFWWKQRKFIIHTALPARVIERAYQGWHQGCTLWAAVYFINHADER